jgi:hypothetical protein
MAAPVEDTAQGRLGSRLSALRSGMQRGLGEDGANGAANGSANGSANDPHDGDDGVPGGVVPKHQRVTGSHREEKS